MQHSESIVKLSAALVAAQAEMPHVPFDETNPFLKNQYASLGSVIETAKPILAAHQLAVSQLVVSAENQIGIETVLLHSSGEWISSVSMIYVGEEKGKSMAQVAGSVISYLRRYSLAAILGLYADKDDDGNKPAKKSEPHPAEPPAELNKIVWTVGQQDALMVANLAKNGFGAKGMLQLSNLPVTATAELILEWGKQYRSKRPIDPTKDSPSATDAADFANAWYTSYKENA